MKIRRRHKHGYPRLDPDSIQACKHCGEERHPERELEACPKRSAADPPEHEWQWTSGDWERLMPPGVRWSLRNDPKAYDEVKRLLTETLEAQAHKYSQKFREELEKGLPEGWRDRVLSAGDTPKPNKPS